MKTRKYINRPHFKNGPNAKNGYETPKKLMKTRKIYNLATCLCAFRKWAKYQKQLKSTELVKEYHNRSTSEGKMKDVVIRLPTLSAKCKLGVYTD